MAEKHDTELTRRLKAEYIGLEQERREWDNHWREISDYILPRKGMWLNRGDDANKGVKRHSKIYDGTATRSLRRLASGMQSGLTSPSRPWFRLSLNDDELLDYGPVKDWLGDVEKLMYTVFRKSNFYSSAHSAYQELGGIGTAAMIEEPDFENVVRFRLNTVGEYVVSTDHRGFIDTYGRRYYMLAKNMVKRFGAEECSIAVQNAAKEDKPKWIQVCQMIKPNDEGDDRYFDNKSMPWSSVYFEWASGVELSVGGFEEFPVMSPRWSTTGSEVYGRSPGMDVLGDVKQLQQETISKMEAIHKSLDPPMRVPANLHREISLIPGAQNPVDANLDNVAVSSMFDMRFDIASVVTDIQDLRNMIKESFFNDVFLIILERPNITATEIMERKQEKMELLGPVIERLEFEFLNPLIDRTFGIMERWGMLPEAPAEIQGQDLKVSYISPLAQAQKMFDAQTLSSFYGFVERATNIQLAAGVTPEVLDKVDIDESIDQYAEATGVPAKVIRADETVEEIREQRRLAMQAAQREAAKRQAVQDTLSGAEQLSKTQTSSGGEDRNALQELMEGMRGE